MRNTVLLCITAATAVLLPTASDATASAETPNAAPASPLGRYLYESHITSEQCTSDGISMVASGQSSAYDCDSSDAGANDGLWALWLFDASVRE
ncbi:hypothetical protein [Amycolatopsis sp. NPDC004079]|uniref:hypothetical protein n=1 Tax=Amycolatopsis sp. NPDC004079 TaxID=3154549 RepID=UPI0033BF4E99